MEKEIEKLQYILKEDPSNFQVRRELSIILAQNGFNEEALSNIQYLIMPLSLSPIEKQEYGIENG